jgi:hypothetical protein
VSSQGSIEQDEMMMPMLAACPSFKPQWEEFLSEWTGNPSLLEDGQDGSLPLYLALSELANHLIEKLEANDTAQFAAVFEVVERWITEGSQYVSEAAIVGLVEDLSSEARYPEASPADFEKWLGPQSRKWWVEVTDFWDRLARDEFRPLSIE